MNLKLLKISFLKELKAITNLSEVKKYHDKFLSKNGILKKYYLQIKEIKDKSKKNYFQEFNQLKTIIFRNLKAKEEDLKLAIAQQIQKEKQIDLNLLLATENFTVNHPIRLIIKEIERIFKKLNFLIYYGQEVEQIKYNFDFLAIDRFHPARLLKDTFYINKDYLLRTHATNSTVKLLSKIDFQKLKKNQNFGLLSIGNVYRNDTEDASHSHQFTQIDGILVGTNVNYANLKSILKYLCQNLFKKQLKIRFRPSYFPFTTPSMEVDIECFNCHLKGCYVCKNSGYIEVLGAGMFNETVLKKAKVPNKYNCLAFGIGIERLVMLKYNLNDVRKLYQNDLRFLLNFNNDNFFKAN